MKKRKSKKKKIWLRPIVQLFFFTLIALIAANHTITENGGGIPFLTNASLHALCPFGGVVTLYQYIVAGTFVQKIHASSLVLMGIVFFLSILFGPVFCGWVCPLGTAQEWVSGLGKKVFKNRFNHFMPSKADIFLRYTRYIMLAWVLYMTAVSGKLIFTEIEPYYALFNFWLGEVALTGLIILGVTLIASLFIERPWCKYVCPYGALLGLTNLFRIFKIKRQPETCINCVLCDKRCPMNINISTKTSINNHQCISCLECTSEAVCPIPNTVDLTTGGK